ncbi:MAG TPA: M23 family metallopeptidase [Sphingobium sp.]
MQITALSVVAMVLGTWMIVMGAMLMRQMSLSAQQSAVAAQQSAVASAAAHARADRRSVDTVASDLEQRQDALDALMKSHFGSDVDPSSVIGKGDATPPSRPRKIGALTGSARLAMLRERQQRFARALGDAAHARLAEVEAAIREVGLNPRQLAGRGAARTGVGGPFIPASHAVAIREDTRLRSLAALLDRLATMEAALGVLPSGRPTMSPILTSSYGYRRDPFNGLAAFHAGLDFPGAYGQPILAASEGRISFVGQRSGYGNCVEVDHGHGIMTRYAHLSGFVARPGQIVTRGQQIARMGSTGRSTGTHLHFEVRVNGAAVDPRPFLEARNHVLEARQDVSQGPGTRGARPSDRG